MHCIKKIMIAFIAICCSHGFAQEIILPNEIWERILISVLIGEVPIERPSDARNFTVISKQLYSVLKIPNVIKTVLAKCEYKEPSYYTTAKMMRIPAITKPYIEANEKLLHTLELTLYQKEIIANPYADINYEGKEGKSRLVMLCSDYPEHKLNWITWLIDNGARDNNAHPEKANAFGAIIKRSIARKSEECNWHSIYYGTCPICLNVKRSCYTVAEMLIQKGGSDPSKHIHAAISSRDSAIVQLLITHGATIKKYDYEWFHDYLHEGNFDENAIKFLLDQGYNPHERGSRQPFGHCILFLENAIQTVELFMPSPKRDRVLNLFQQYPKKTSDDADSN